MYSHHYSVDTHGLCSFMSREVCRSSVVKFGPIPLLETAKGLVVCCFCLQSRMNSSPKDIPNVLNTGQIPRHSGPVHSVYIVNTKKVVDDTTPMGSDVVVLEYRVSDWHLAQKRQHMWRQNFVDVSLTV